LSTRIEIGDLERLRVTECLCNEEVCRIARKNFGWAVEVLDWIPIGKGRHVIYGMNLLLKQHTTYHRNSGLASEIYHQKKLDLITVN